MLSQIPEIEFGPLVSIIITNYNYRCFLPAAIDSALKQSYHGVEVILVDDGSTDNSREIIIGYGNKILPLFKEHGGQGSAINAGFQRSQGDIVIFLDADDMLLPNIVGRVVESFRAHRDLIKVMYRLELIDGAGMRIGEIRPHKHLPLLNGDLRRHVLTFPFDMTWTAMSGNAFAARALRKILPMPERDFPILADFYLSHLTPLFGPTMFLQDIGAYYRIHGANNFTPVTPEVSVPHIRQYLTYASRTCVHIKQCADELELEERPAKVSDLYSVSLLANRLISLKLDPDEHPIADDSLWRLLRLGFAASCRRFDVCWLMKAFYILWFALMIPAPRWLARWLADVFSFPENRKSLNNLLVTFKIFSKRWIGSTNE